MNTIKRRCINLTVIVCVMVIICLIGSVIAKKEEKEIMPQHNVTTEIGTNMTALSIKDVDGCKKVTAFNIVKNEFLHNSQPVGAVYSHDINDLGTRGTIQIFIENIDPMAEDYNTQAALTEHLKVENSYKFSIHIPQTLAANIVYANAQFLSATGEIENYDFIEFINQPKVTETHISETDPVTINITMNAERRYMSPDSPLRNGSLITIHYEAPDGKNAILDGDILIGVREAVDEAVQRNNMSLYLVQVLSIAIFAMLVFVTILKKRIEFLPQIMYLFGIAGLYSSAVIYTSSCEHPYLIMSLKGIFASVVALGVALSVKRKLSAIPVRMILCILASVLCICSFALPMVTGNAEKALDISIKILQAVILTSASLLIIYELLTENKVRLKLSGFAALVFLAICIFDDSRLQFFSPIFGISVVLLIITAYTVIHEFMLLETRNRYLTDNLEAEVERQTESLTHIISEREDLLRYISHDLRKPIIGIRKLLPDVTSDDKLTAKNAVAGMEGKLVTVDNALGEISKFAKTNYHAEQSVVLSIDEILKKVKDDLTTDCAANGVHLRVKYSGFTVFAKPNSLSSILSNLIFNALEHSGCDTIEISVERYGKKQCILKVSDNGKGAANTATLFTPYSTTYDQDSNVGLGLYISKQFAVSMGGDLLYQRENNITTFSVILPVV